MIVKKGEFANTDLINFVLNFKKSGLNSKCICKIEWT